MIANCPYCRNEFYVPVDLGGRTVNCAKCKKPVHAPALRPEELELDLPKLLVGEEGSQKCLEQIKAMRVFAAVDSVAEKLGLTAKKIRSDVELQLQKWGITLLSERQLIKNPRMPILAVSVQALEGPQEYVAFNFEIQFFQKATLCNGTEDRYEVPTWRRAVFGSRRLCDVADVRNSIRERVDEFIIDYVTANPQLVVM